MQVCIPVESVHVHAFHCMYFIVYVYCTYFAIAYMHVHHRSCTHNLFANTQLFQPVVGEVQCAMPSGASLLCQPH